MGWQHSFLITTVYLVLWVLFLPNIENHDETSRTTIQPSAGKMIVLNSSHYEEHLVYIEIKTTILSVTLSVILWNASVSILLLYSRTDVISKRFSSDPRLNFMIKKKWSYQLTPVIFSAIFMHHHEKSDDFTEQYTELLKTQL